MVKMRKLSDDDRPWRPGPDAVMCSTSMTSVLSVVPETGEARCSSDGAFICKKVLKQ